MLFHLLFIAIPLALLLLFLATVSYEERAGRRLVLSGTRYLFDRKMERTVFIVQHVDWGAFFHDLTKSGAERLLHDLAHGSLIIVRAIERELTGVVRSLRARREPTALPLPGADEQKPLSNVTAYLKKSVRRSRKLPPRE